MPKLAATVATLSILLVFGLTGLADGSLPPFYGYSETVIHVLPDTQSNENESTTRCEIFDVYMKDLLVRNMQGNVITETTVGSQVLLEATVINTCDNRDKAPLLALFEVRDSDGITLYLTWQNSTINSNRQITVGSSWVAPYVTGEYTVRAFYIPCLQCPMILSNVMQYKLVVLPVNE